jgi:hypothetical protein
MGGGSGGGGQTTQTQKADPWEGAQPYLREAYTQAGEAANNTTTAAFGGNFVNPANATQRTATDMARRAAGTLSTGQGVLDVANASLRGDMLNANPYLQQAIDATIRPTVQNATDVMLPAVGVGAGSAGAFGGTRQAFLEGMVMRDTNQQVADTAAQMWNDNYARERGIQTQVAPQLLQVGNALQMAPAQAMLDVGNQQYSLDDLARQNQQMRFEDEINRHWRAVNPYIAALSGLGMPGGQSVTTGTGQGVNRNAAMASGAVAGAAAGAPLAGATYGLSIPIGAVIGGAGGYFGAR